MTNSCDYICRCVFDYITRHTCAPIHVTIASHVLLLRIHDAHAACTMHTCAPIHITIASHVLLLRIHYAHATCTMHTCAPIHITIASHVLLFRIYDAHAACTMHTCAPIHMSCGDLQHPYKLIPMRIVYTSDQCCGTLQISSAAKLNPQSFFCEMRIRSSWQDGSYPAPVPKGWETRL